MHGLKIKITFSLFLLLAVAMLLTNVVITALWQRSLIAEQIDHQQRSLSIFLQTVDNDQDLIEKYLANKHVHFTENCSGILTAKTWKMLSNTTCGEPEKLQQLAEKVMNSGQPAASSTGTTMGIFLPQQKYLHIAVPFPASFPDQGVIAIASPLRPIWKALRKNQKIILVYILVNTLILTVIGFFRLSSIIIRPIDKLVQATHDYSGEQNRGFVSEQKESEFRQLSSSITGMVQRIDKDKDDLKNMVNSLAEANQTIQQNQQEMVRTEKLASVGRLSAGLAHEIGNPLGIVLGYLGLLQKEDLSREERLEYIQRSEQELNRINTLVRQLLDFSRPLSTSAKERVRVHEILHDIIKMLQSQKKNRNITFTADVLEQNDTVLGSKEALRQAFVNFFLNAIDAIRETTHPDQGTITVESTVVRDEQKTAMLQVSITDNGCGIPPSELENIFDPFYTTKDPGKGTGLGLSVSFGIIEKSGGTIDIESAEGNGSTIIVKLPLYDGIGRELQ